MIAPLFFVFCLEFLIFVETFSVLFTERRSSTLAIVCLRTGNFISRRQWENERKVGIANEHGQVTIGLQQILDDNGNPVPIEEDKISIPFEMTAQVIGKECGIVQGKQK
jgi:hypothetical protein